MLIVCIEIERSKRRKRKKNRNSKRGEKNVPNEIKKNVKDENIRDRWELRERKCFPLHMCTTPPSVLYHHRSKSNRTKKHTHTQRTQEERENDREFKNMKTHTLFTLNLSNLKVFPISAYRLLVPILLKRLSHFIHPCHLLLHDSRFLSQ